ncbi:hypothetical protein BHE74_00032034 [Ensete ventricosum]|nr:hypothetical protein BHE74_00032034 [Ensete ventricosum]
MRLRAFGAVPSPKPQAATMASYGRRHPGILSDGYDVIRSTLFQDLGCRRCPETSGDGVRLQVVVIYFEWQESKVKWDRLVMVLLDEVTMVLSSSSSLDLTNSFWTSSWCQFTWRNYALRELAELEERVSGLCKLGVEVMELCASRSVVAPGTPKRNSGGVAGSRHLVIARLGTLPVEQGNSIVPSRKHVVEELPVVPVVGYEG